MRTPVRILAALALCAIGVRCGYTVGDACTTAGDCGNQLCLNQDIAPGGYCSLPCTAGGSCPNGSSCVLNGAGPNRPACFRSCQTSADCRHGYACLPTPSGQTVCVGPPGF